MREGEVLKVIDKIKEKVEGLLPKYNLVLYKVERVNEYGMTIYRVYVDDPNSFQIDIDLIAKIHEELLDLVNDELEDGTYLEVSSVGIERELTNDDEIRRAISNYIYVSCYQKIEGTNEKEFYGDLISYDDEILTLDVVIKTRHKEVKINKKQISKIRLAVKF